MNNEIFNKIFTEISKKINSNNDFASIITFFDVYQFHGLKKFFIEYNNYEFKNNIELKKKIISILTSNENLYSFSNKQFIPLILLDVYMDITGKSKLDSVNDLYHDFNGKNYQDEINSKSNNYYILRSILNSKSYYHENFIVLDKLINITNGILNLISLNEIDSNVKTETLYESLESLKNTNTYKLRYISAIINNLILISKNKEINEDDIKYLLFASSYVEFFKYNDFYLVNDEFIDEDIYENLNRTKDIEDSVFVKIKNNNFFIIEDKILKHIYDENNQLIENLINEKEIQFINNNLKETIVNLNDLNADIMECVSKYKIFNNVYQNENFNKYFDYLNDYLLNDEDVDFVTLVKHLNMIEYIFANDEFIMRDFENSTNTKIFQLKEDNKLNLITSLIYENRKAIEEQILINNGEDIIEYEKQKTIDKEDNMINLENENKTTNDYDENEIFVDYLSKDDSITDEILDGFFEECREVIEEINEDLPNLINHYDKDKYFKLKNNFHKLRGNLLTMNLFYTAEVTYFIETTLNKRMMVSKELSANEVDMIHKIIKHVTFSLDNILDDEIATKVITIMKFWNLATNEIVKPSVDFIEKHKEIYNVFLEEVKNEERKKFNELNQESSIKDNIEPEVSIVNNNDEFIDNNINNEEKLDNENNYHNSDVAQEVFNSTEEIKEENYQEEKQENNYDESSHVNSESLEESDSNYNTTLMNNDTHQLNYENNDNEVTYDDNNIEPYNNNNIEPYNNVQLTNEIIEHNNIEELNHDSNEIVDETEVLAVKDMSSETNTVTEEINNLEDEYQDPINIFSNDSEVENNVINSGENSFEFDNNFSSKNNEEQNNIQIHDEQPTYQNVEESFENDEVVVQSNKLEEELPSNNMVDNNFINNNQNSVKEVKTQNINFDNYAIVYLDQSKSYLVEGISLVDINKFHSLSVRIKDSIESAYLINEKLNDNAENEEYEVITEELIILIINSYKDLTAINLYKTASLLFKLKDLLILYYDNRLEYTKEIYELINEITVHVFDLVTLQNVTINYNMYEYYTIVIDSLMEKNKESILLSSINQIVEYEINEFKNENIAIMAENSQAINDSYEVTKDLAKGFGKFTQQVSSNTNKLFKEINNISDSNNNINNKVDENTEYLKTSLVSLNDNLKTVYKKLKFYITGDNQNNEKKKRFGIF